MIGPGARIGLIVNPTSGKNTGALIGRDVLTLLEAAGYAVHDLSAMDADHARRRGRAAIDDGAIDALVVVGGDGMVHLGVDLVAQSDIPLGIVAAGTGNDTARELGLPVRDAAKAVERIAHGATRRIDAVRQISPHGQAQWFVGVMAAGFDAIVNERANTWNWPKGRLRYTLATLREVTRFAPLDYTLEIDGSVRHTSAMLVAIANGPAYGAGMKIAPQARFDDGELDVVIIRDVPITTLARVFPRVYAGTHGDHLAVEFVRAQRVRVAAPGVVAYADGERFAPLPVECQVVPGTVVVFT